MTPLPPATELELAKLTTKAIEGISGDERNRVEIIALSGIGAVRVGAYRSGFEDCGIIAQVVHEAYDLGLLAGRHAERETGWQPIESAPKDGTRILLATAHGSVVMAHWLDNSKLKPGMPAWSQWAGWHYDAPTTRAVGDNPINWRPLPASPGGEP